MFALFFVSLISTGLCIPAWEDDSSFADPFHLISFISEFNGFDGFGVNADPSPCCLPKQWQGVVKSVMGLNGGGRKLFGEEESLDRRSKGKVQAQTLVLYVDETNKRIAGKSICPVTQAEWFSFIITFKTGSSSGATLNLFNSTAQKCRTINLNKAQFKDQCIPKYARFIGSLKIGAADGGLGVNSFTYNRTTRMATMYANTLVTPDACLPIVAHAVGKVCGRFAGLLNLNIDLGEELDEEVDGPKPGPPTGLNFVASSFFYNLQASISDPSVFTPPSYCPKVSTDDSNKLKWKGPASLF